MSLLSKTADSIKPIFLMLAISATGVASVPEARSESPIEKQASSLAVIKGIVRDSAGSPIADATVAIFRAGTSKLLKQVSSAKDGSFIAKVMPGTYTVLAVAEGYNPVTLAEVQVANSAQLTYGFKLERAGSGNTLPEKRLDRNNPKWVIRSAQTSRSIYQNSEGELTEVAAAESAVLEQPAETEEGSRRRKGQTVTETYFAATERGSYGGVNIATLLPVNEDAEIILAGQLGVGSNAPQRFEAQAKFRPNDDHKVKVSTSYGNLGSLKIDNEEQDLDQVSVQALDEWKVREGVIVVFGLDYSKFLGAGSDFSVSPRLGLQFDINDKTRFRSSYTTQTEERTWAKAIELEDAQMIFREPAAIEDFVVEEGKPLMNKSRRLEFGIERVLDNNSSIEANAFFDATPGRGVGLMNLPFNDGAAFTELVGNQQGRAQGFRLVYSRRLNGNFSASAGYSLGSGQKLSGLPVSNPADLFKTDFFQSFFGQFDADFKTGTSVKTIFRLSPQATVFAIDPFQGRLAIYDPSLSILVTQNLPTLGLPIHAEAVVDARNLFDFQTGVVGEEGSLMLNSQRRGVRGGILVRF